MKRIITLAVVALTLFTMVGCSKQEANVPVNEIMDSITAQITADMIEGGVPEDRFVDGNIPGFGLIDLKSEEENPFASMFESFNEEDLAEGQILMQMMSVKSDLIIVLKAEDESKVQTLIESLEDQLQTQDNIWSSYLPDQYAKVQNNIIKTNGNYLLYVTYENPEAIEAIFDNALNN